MILYRKYQKYIPKKKKYIYIFTRGFIFKKYEDNSRDQMHWMGFYETCLLIISNHSHHLHEKN